jgi:hypothetical protein
MRADNKRFTTRDHTSASRAITPSIDVIESLYFAGPYRIPYHC